MTTKQPQSHAELSQHLQDHLGFLLASADAYDNGFDGEAKRLAVSVRLLVHDTNNSKSLLGQLGQKNIQFFESAFPVVKGNQNTHGGLVMTSLSPSKGARYVAFLDDAPHGQMRTTDFDTWWNSTVFIDSKGSELSRKGLVLAVANQDGGAHVDPSLNQTYADLSRNNSLGWVFSDGKTTQPMEGPERAAIRQIAHEFLKSLIPGYTKTPVYPPDGMIMGGAVVLQGADATARVASLSEKKKVGRNESCPCGSGKKFKRCCGASV
jgi:hypothetical protein